MLVAGLSVDQATEAIRAGLAKDYLVSPRVSLSIVSYAKKKINVMGEVRTPGLYSYPEHGALMLSDAIAMAGGLLPTSDAAHVSVRRVVDDKPVVTQVDASDGNGAANAYEVKPDDAITVAVLPKRHFTVLGQINRPGDYDVNDDRPIYLTDAIALAGGFTRLANPSHVLLKRSENGRETVLAVDAEGDGEKRADAAAAASRTRTRSPCRKACSRKDHARAPRLRCSGPPITASCRAAGNGGGNGASDIVCVLLEKLWLIALMAVAGFFATYGYLARQAPVYRATGSLQVVPPMQVQPDKLVDAEPNLSTAEELNTLVQEPRAAVVPAPGGERPGTAGRSFALPAQAGRLGLHRPGKDPGAGRLRARHAAQGHAADRGLGTAHPAGHRAAALRRHAPQFREGADGEQERIGGGDLPLPARRGGPARRGAGATRSGRSRSTTSSRSTPTQIAAQRAAIEQLSQRYKDKYPAMIEARSLLQNAAGQLRRGDDPHRAQRRGQRRQAGRGDRSRTWASTTRLRARMIGQYQVLKRDLETQRALFASLTAQKNQSDVLRSAQKRDGGEDRGRAGAARTARAAEAAGAADRRNDGGRGARSRAGISAERDGPVAEDGGPGGELSQPAGAGRRSGAAAEAAGRKEKAGPDRRAGRPADPDATAIRRRRRRSARCARPWR